MVPSAGRTGDLMQVIKLISEAFLPCLILLLLLTALHKKADGYQAFLKGSGESLTTILNILPPLVGLMVAIAMLRSSGLLSFLCRIISPVTNLLGIPEEVLPLAFLRPISGSGGLAMLSDLLKTYGADSLPGTIASVMAGSTETTFYTIAVYFGALKITDTRYAVKAALVADAVGILASIFITPLFLK